MKDDTEDVCPNCENEDTNRMDFQSHELIDGNQWKQNIVCHRCGHNFEQFYEMKFVRREELI